jgi:A/G-specific adenine glycosylase
MSSLVAPLLAWYDRAARDLPWRRPDAGPWAVLVSEIMLQQTPVSRVLPAYDAWLTRWPTPSDLAAEPAGEAVRMWGRLGYPRRALHLHQCATIIRDEHDGVLPQDVEILEQLPGIGAYTARAIAAFAYGQRVPVVDTNVRRTVARAVDGRAAAGPPSTTRDHRAVEALLPNEPTRAARFSVALMELGALICTARSPRCDVCPIARDCAWRAAGYPAYDGPKLKPQKFEGTDRQVRGRLMAIVRESTEPVTRATLDTAWPEETQRERALASLLADGLITSHGNETYALPH